MPRRLIAFLGIFLTLLGFGAGDAFLLTRALCDKAYVENLLKDALHRDCKFHRFQLLPLNHVLVEKLRLESAHAPEALPVFHIQKMDVTFGSSDLLRGRLVPAEVHLDTPELNLVRNKLTGEYELLSLIEDLGKGAGTPGGATTLPVFVVSHGVFRVQDENIFRGARIETICEVNFTLRPYHDTTSRIEGSLFVQDVGLFEVSGEIDLARRYYHIDLNTPDDKPIRLDSHIADILATGEGHDLLHAWNNYKPEGPVGLQVSFTHDPSKTRAEDFTVVVEPRGIAVTAKAFPLPVQDVKGRLEFTRKGAVIKEVKCRSGATRLKVDGETDGYEREAGFHLKIDMEDLAFDERLKGALHPTDQKTYELFHPSGVANAVAEIDRPRGEDVKIRNHVWIRCKGAAFTYQRFPYPIERVAGEIELDGDRIEVKGVTGFNGETQILVKGTIEDLAGDSDVDITVEGSKIKLDPRLYEALGEPSRKVWKRLSPEGQVSLVWTGKRKKGSGKPLAQAVSLVLNGTNVLYDAFPYALTDLHGEVVWESASETIDIRGVDGRHGAAQARVTGSVRDMSGDAAFDLKVEGTDIMLDEELKKALTPENRAIWDKFHPDGPVDVVWEGHGVGGANKDIRQKLTTKLKGCAATWEKLPLRIEGLTGSVAYDEDGTRIDHVTGKRGDADFAVDGTVGTGEAAPFDVRVNVKGLPLEKEVVEALPERIRTLLTDAKAKGNVNLDGRFQEKDDSGGKRRTLYSATVDLGDLDLDPGTPLTKLDGQVKMSGEVDEKEHRARGEVSVGRVRLNGKLLTKLHGPFVYEDDRLVFQGVRGDVYEGHIEGDLKFDVPSGGFTSDLTLSGLDLRTFARDTFISEKEVAGTLGAHAVVKGTAKDRKTWTGSVDMDVQDGELWEVPFFYRVFSVLSLTEDRKGKFESGKLHGYLADGRLHVEKMRFDGKNVSLEGEGTIGYDGALNLELNTNLKSVGVGLLDPFMKLFKPITNKIYAIEAKGTFQEPEMSLRPLPFLFNDNGDDRKKPPK